MRALRAPGRLRCRGERLCFICVSGAVFAAGVRGRFGTLEFGGGREAPGLRSKVRWLRVVNWAVERMGKFLRAVEESVLGVEFG